MSEALFRIVEGYASLGPHHRTGTAPDEATLEWFADALSARGARVERRPWTFERFTGEWSVRVGSDEVPCDALFYGAVGGYASRSPLTGAGEVAAGARAPALDELRRPGETAVFATLGASGRLIALNREPVVEDSPAVLVPGSWADRIAAEPVEVAYDARTVPGRSGNVIGRLGSGAAPIVLATPLSGWFTCAGERGTGIAVTLELASRLSARCPVVVCGTSGHELGGLGLQELLRDELGERPRGVVHLGASLAAAGPDGDLTPTRYAAGSIPDHDALTEALAPIGLVPVDNRGPRSRDPSRWLGEAREWCALGVPLVSFAGSSHLFHTPDDTPDRATSPELLSRVTDAVEGAVRLLV